ncbi:MAG: hypothetical protein HY652_13335 [Acidobacteria bacterium]|nr:hypothetical protein [Acidobacteriota bacterium]
MVKRFRQFLQVRPGEGFITSLMFLYIFGVLTFYYILKPMRSSFFLKNLPSTSLPWAYILTALFAGTLTTLLFKFSRRLSVIALLTATNLAIIGTLFYFRWAMGREIGLLPYVWFVYLQIVSVLSVAQFWLLAGYVYDNRQAKRIYGLLGAGAIAGAIAGSFLPGFLSKRLTTDLKLLVCVGICAVLILLGQVAWRYRRPETDQTRSGRRYEESRERLADLLRLVFGSPHLFRMALLVFLTLIASQITEWQVNNALDTAYAGLSKDAREDQIDEFWGRFYFVTNILGITLQLALTGFVLRRFGIGASILFLPVALFGASLGVFLAPALWATALALGANNVFRYSINRAGLELVYLPLSPVVRKKLKLFIDVFIDRFGRLVAALVILTFTTSYFPFGLRGTAVATLLLTALSVLVCVVLRKAYVNAFREQLARREVDWTEIARYVTDPASVQLLVGSLGSSQERQILYSLRLLQSARGVDFAGQLMPLLRHPSPFVREEAVRTLPALSGDHQADAERLLADPSEGVRLAAVDYLCSLVPGETVVRLESLLNHDDLNVRLAAAFCAAGHAEPSFRPSLNFVRSLLAVEGPRATQARAAAARLAARLPTSESVSLLKELLRDLQPEVAGAAGRAAGAAGHLDLIFDVLPMLAHRKSRGAAREALLLYGPRVVGTLGDALADTGRELALRREIPWVLSRIPTRRSVDLLADQLHVEDPLLKYRVVKALNRLYELKPDLPRQRPLIAERIYAETKAYYEALTLLQAVAPEPGSGGGNLLERALRERMDQNLEIIFRLLGLRYPQKDIYFAYAALKGNRADRRAAAIEFLDNLLHKNLKSIILPLLEESSAERLIDRANRLFGIQTKRREEALRLVLEQPDVWLKVCALHEVGARPVPALSDICRRLSADGEPLIRETAEWALKRGA